MTSAITRYVIGNPIRANFIQSEALFHHFSSPLFGPMNLTLSSSLLRSSMIVCNSTSNMGKQRHAINLLNERKYQDYATE